MEDCIKMVIWSLKNAHGGEIIVPKIPSFRIKDLASLGASISSRVSCRSSGNSSFIWNNILPAATYWPRLFAVIAWYGCQNEFRKSY